MGPPNHPLLQSWGYARFTIKAFIVFVGIMTITLLFKDISKPIDDARLAIYSRWWGAPLLFFVFLPFYMMYEIVRYRLWGDICETQPDPRRFGKPTAGAAPSRRSQRKRGN